MNKNDIYQRIYVHSGLQEFFQQQSHGRHKNTDSIRFYFIRLFVYLALYRLILTIRYNQMDEL